MTHHIKNRVLKQAAKGFRGFPVATVAYYGPNASKATKVVVSLIRFDGAEPELLERWFGEERDLRLDDDMTRRILRFVREHEAKSVAAVGAILGCPHEEGIEYPAGEACPMCPYWAGRDRWKAVTG